MKADKWERWRIGEEKEVKEEWGRDKYTYVEKTVWIFFEEAISALASGDQPVPKHDRGVKSTSPRLVFAYMQTYICFKMLHNYGLFPISTNFYLYMTLQVAVKE